MPCCPNAEWTRGTGLRVHSVFLFDSRGVPSPTLGYLLGFAVQPVLATTRAELLEFQPVRVVALVLGRSVVAVLTLSTSQVDDYAVCFLCHFFLSRNEKREMRNRLRSLASIPHSSFPKCHSMILATTPAPTVRPPSRIAKRRPSTIATGTISSTIMSMLSPGITI